jgi:hypothetical protein
MRRKILLILFSTILIFGLVYVFAILKQTNVSLAGSSDNTSGWAWSENIGWISFNNTDGGGSTDYGVNIDADGNFSGYAWSENIGWLNFAPPGPYPGAPNYSAKLDIATNKVSGWARFCAGTINGNCNSASRADGWDGWVKMAGTANNGSSYGVSRSGCNLIGYAWGSDVVGWINFKGMAQDDSSYGVTTSYCAALPPAAPSNLIVNSGTCSSIKLSWLDNSDNEDGFKIERSLDSTFSSPFIIDNASQSGTGGIVNYTDYGLVENTTYYYRVRAYNAAGYSTYSNQVNYKTSVCPSVDLKARKGGTSDPFTYGPFQLDIGNDLDLQWTSSGADSCSASGGWSGSRSISGSETIKNLTKSVIFTITCSNATGSDVGTGSINVTVAFKPWWKEIIPW